MYKPDNGGFDLENTEFDMPTSHDLKLGPQQSGTTSFGRDDKSQISFSKNPS